MRARLRHDFDPDLRQLPQGRALHGHRVHRLYWGTKGQILWDELLWVGGFALIERNVFEWRAGLLEGPLYRRPAPNLKVT